MKQKYLLIGLILLIGVSSIFAINGFLLNNSASAVSPSTITYYAEVCTTVTRADGTVEPNGCSHNLLYNVGKDAIKNSIGTGGTLAAFTTISTCNATAGCGTMAVDNSEIFNTYGNCGLSAAAGTYASGATGNWSVAKTFTATCDNVEVNATRLQNSTIGNFSGNTFTKVTLQTNDQLTINWSISVS